MTAIAGALVINIGTLSTPWIAAMFKAGEAARRNARPIILDPVGAGATTFRTATARKLLGELRPAIVRGNASRDSSAGGRRTEHARGRQRIPGGRCGQGRGRAVHAYGCVVATSGAVDLISSGGTTIRVFNGHPLMPKVTGLGCTASALAGAFAAVNPSAREAAVNAMAVMGDCGELAANMREGQERFWFTSDALYLLDEADIRERVKVEES